MQSREKIEFEIYASNELELVREMCDCKKGGKFRTPYSSGKCHSDS